MQFVFQSLAWGFLLVAVPLLIHLINLLRYQRVRWAAMQFLLESYRRNRRWVWMKQVLLLLSRMALMAVLVAMLAQWVSGARLLSLLGRTVTHHYVLIDDSMSMAQRVGDGTLYERGLRATSSLLQRATQDGGNHQLTLIRFSRAALAPKSTSEAQNVSADAIADTIAKTFVGKSDELFTQLTGLGTADADVDGIPAAALVQAMLSNPSGSETPIVYYVSDFREKEWNQPSALKTSLQNLESQGARLELVDCADDANNENISLTALVPDQEVLAAEVPVLLRLTVKNQGQNEVQNLNVRVTSYEFRNQQQISFDKISSGQGTELPSLLIDRLGPGESTTRSVQVVFPGSGSHVVTAACGEDSLLNDNRIACVLNVATSQRVLIVDDSAERSAAGYLRSALAPGGITRTGWDVAVESSAFLRDSQIESLQEFASVLLADVNQLDERAIRNLREYVEQGGGLAVFPARSWSTADALRISQQLTKQPSAGSAEPAAAQAPLLPRSLSNVRAFSPQEIEDANFQKLTIEPHPIFEPFMSLSISPFQFVRFSKIVEVSDAEEGRAAERSTQGRVIASLGTKLPLIIDSAVGQGHVVLFTVAMDPSWNSWVQDPTFVVVALKLSGYLASFRREATSQPVTSEVAYTFSPRDYLPDVELVVPGNSESSRQSIQLKGTAIDERSMSVHWDPKSAADQDDQVQKLRAGIRELWLTPIAKGREIVNFAANPPAREGELRHTLKADLENRLEPLDFHYQTAVNTLETNPFVSGAMQQNWLLGLLILLLLLEQALAYWASYHLPQRGNAQSELSSNAKGVAA